MHGWGLTHESFLNFASGLKNFKCIFVDLYGFGKSIVEYPLTLFDYAKGIEQIINDEQLDDVTLVGHSFGGRISILLASYCQKIKGVVLVDAAGLKPRLTLKKMFRVIDYKIKKYFNFSTINCGSSDYKALTDQMKITFNNVIHLYLNDYLAKINQDCLIIWGKKDKETPLYMAHTLKKDIKNSALLLLKGGHFAYAENANEFLIILKAYLNGIYTIN